jgi:hypothetical protein
MQLLVVGRSLKTADDRPSPYRLSQQNLLPRFDRSEGSADAKPQSGNTAPVHGAAMELPRYRARRYAEQATATATSEDCSSKESRARQSGDWASRWRNRFRVQSLNASRDAVQGELGFERVRVVRNDLSDADLELVSASKTAHASVMESRTESLSNRLNRILMWPRIAARLFGGSRS